MAEPLVPQVDIRLDLLLFRKHNGAHVVGFEDKHPPFTTPLRDYLAFLFYEAVEMRESNLHTLVDDLNNRHRVFRYCRDMQHVHEFPFLLEVAEGNFADMFDGVRSVVSLFDHSV